jgi:uncharacterized membrane protein YfcA
LLQFDARDTAMLAAFVTCSGALVSCGISSVQPHPTHPSTRPLIDYGSVLVVAPAMLLGVAGGVVLNAIAPLWLLQALALAVFFWSLWRNSASLRLIWRKEGERLAAERALAADVAVEKEEEEEEGGGNGGSSKSSPSRRPEQPSSVSRPSRRLRLRRRASRDLERLASLDQELVELEAAAGLSFSVVGARSGSLAAALEEVAAAREGEEGDNEDDEAEAAAGRSKEEDDDREEWAAAPAGRRWRQGRRRQRSSPSSSRSQGRAAAFAAAAKAWAHRQPVVLILLTAFVLAQQVVFSVLQRAVEKPCSNAWYGTLAAHVAVTAALAALAAVVVMRFNNNHDAKAAAAEGAAGAALAVGGQEEEEQEAPPPPPPQQQQQQDPPPPASSSSSARKERRAADRAAKLAANNPAIQWHPAGVAKMNAAMLVVGILGGCLGFGGGFAVAPLLLSMGMHPQVQAGTCNAVLFLATLGSSAAFLISGRLPLDYALVFGLINVVFTPLGVVAINAAIRKTGRPSIIVALNVASYVLGIVVLLALSAVPTWVATARGQVEAGFAVEGVCPQVAPTPGSSSP